MIRGFNKKDLDEIMDLWLATNISAHSFIEDKYWSSNYDAVKEMLPTADIYIYQDGDEIQGFIGLVDNYIGGIFVLDRFQSKGIGKGLLDYAKNKKEELFLRVYKKNNKAVEFYTREKFKILNEKIDEVTNEIELTMIWKK